MRSDAAALEKPQGAKDSEEHDGRLRDRVDENVIDPDARVGAIACTRRVEIQPEGGRGGNVVRQAAEVEGDARCQRVVAGEHTCLGVVDIRCEVIDAGAQEEADLADRSIVSASQRSMDVKSKEEVGVMVKELKSPSVIASAWLRARDGALPKA